MQRGDIAKIVISVLLLLFLVFVSLQIYVFSGKAKEAAAIYDVVKARHEEAESDHRKLSDEFRYYANPANLEKELRARLNYRAPGEKTLILVPEGSKSNISD